MPLPARGKRGKIATDVELAKLPTDDEVLDSKTATEERRESELEELLAELGSDTTVKIWRRGIEGAGKNAMCGSMSGDGFTLDLLLDTYGGGDYALHIFQGRTLKDKVQVSLDPSVPPRNPRIPKTNGAAPGSQLSDMTGILGAMATMSMQGMQMMQAMMAGQANNTNSMMTAMATMMTAKGEGKDPMDVALRMVELLGKRDGGNGQMAEMMSMLEKGMNIGAKLNPSGDDGVMNVVGEGVKTLGVLIDGIVTKQKAEAARITAGHGIPTIHNGPYPHADTARVTPSAGTAGADVDGASDVAASEVRGDILPMSVDSGERPWVAATRPHIGLLLGAAKFMSAQAAADTVGNNLTDDQFFDLMDDIHDQSEPGFGVRLVEYFPGVRDVSPEWIGQLLDALIHEYTESASDATNDGAPGDGDVKGGDVESSS